MKTDKKPSSTESVNLHQARLEKDKQKFILLINGILPALRQYIVRRLKMADSTGLVARNRIIPEEVVDQAYIRLYENYGNSASDDLETWVYRKVDEVLDQLLNEEAFEKEHLVKLNELEEIELSGLDEKYTIDAEGELIMNEELDDVSYVRQLYDPVKFIEDYQTLESIENDLSEFDRKKLHDEVQRHLVRLPEEDRTVFDLFWLVGLSMKQISQIRKIPLIQVENILKRVGANLRNKLAGLKDR